MPKTENNDNSSSRASLSKKTTKNKLLRDNTPLETLTAPKPIDKDLPNAPNTYLSSEKQKEYNDENDRVVKKLKALLA